MIRSILLVTMAIMATSCQNYQANLQQGTELTDTKVSQLKKNLTQDQVYDVLGSPTLVPTVDQSVWHYTYWTLPGNKRNADPHYKSLTLYFNKKNQLVSYRGNWDIQDLPQHNPQAKKNETTGKKQ
jgi:outer membrane protein assembly factor BamE (lipoprotein component of BamABCDE complex)